MNYLRFAGRLLASRCAGKAAPLQLNIHLTDACNLRCGYCYIDFAHAAPDLPLESLRKILREARSCGTERISLEGGEPLLRRDIGEIAACVRGLGMECNINTNGYLFARRLPELRGLDVLSVSLDGPAEIHDGLRGKGSYDKAVEAVRLARAEGIRVNVLSVLTRANKGQAAFLCAMARELDFQWIPTSLFFRAGADPESDPSRACQPSDEEYRVLIDELIALKRGGARIVWSESTLRYVRDWPMGFLQSNLLRKELGSRPGFKPLPCSAGRYFCVMQTNGDLYSCDPLLGCGKAANAVELGFEEAFRRVSTQGCAACDCFVCNEYHGLFALRPGVVANLLRNYAFRR